MNTEAIVATLLAAAAFLKKPLQEATTETVKDLFDAARYYLRKKFGSDSDGAKVLDLALEKPESVMRKAVLVEEAISANVAADAELLRLIERLSVALPVRPAATGPDVRVNGDRNRVQVAARDIINTERHVHRNTITPDERHVDGEQKRQLSAIIADVADRLAGPDGRPRFGAVHQMLQRKFNVSAFALLPRERFDEALAFLRQQRAIHRGRLRRRNPAVYQQDFFRIIRSRCAELGWDDSRLREFATRKLGLKEPLQSLRELGSVQLKSLARALADEHSVDINKQPPDRGRDSVDPVESARISAQK